MQIVSRSLTSVATLILAALPAIAQTDAPAATPGLQPGSQTEAPAGVGGLAPPAIEILGFNSTIGNLCDTSGGPAFLSLDIYFEASGGPTYNCYQLFVDGVGQVSAPFCQDLTGLPSGMYTYGQLAEVPYTVAPGTEVSGRILTYVGNFPSDSGRLNYVASFTLPCDDPASISITNGSGIAQAIPTLGGLGLVALALGLGGLSIFLLRRKRAALS